MNRLIRYFRRDFLLGATSGGTAILAGCALANAQQQEKEISPVEDLMREHGVLKRVLLVYRDIIGKVDGGAPPPADTISGGANIIRRFIEAYHEKLEEDHLFPRFRKARRLVDLVDVLEDQHRKGRTVTATILKLSASPVVPASAAAKQLSVALREFVRMYEPHEAREDTVLFPAFHDLVPDREYEKLGDQFEEREHELFGTDGFEKMVAEVAAIEKKLGIYDLASFTPS